MRISDWSSDVCSSDLNILRGVSALASQRLLGVDQICPAATSWPSKAFTRVCHPGPLSRRCSTVFASKRILTSTLGVSDLGRPRRDRSEELTSELQSLMRLSYAVFCLKKTTNHTSIFTSYHCTLIL